MASDNARYFSRRLPHRSACHTWRSASNFRTNRRIATPLKLACREAIWAIRALRDKPLPLFAGFIPEATEPHIALCPLIAGQEVVEDFGTTGLTLREHPIAFLRPDITARRIRPCAEILRAKDGRWLTIAGLVLLRQRPGSASGVLFMTIEDETGTANLIVWPKVFEKQRRLILSSPMIAAKGRVQREGEVIHFVTQEFFDLSGLLRSVGDRDHPLFGRENGAGKGEPLAPGQNPSDKHLHDPRASGIKVPARDFR